IKKTPIMKKFKNILFLLLVLLSAALNAQEITNTFPGTWHHDNNNQRFIVKIWHEGDHFEGHYKMVQLNNGSVTSVLYDSRRVPINGMYFPPTIYGKPY